MGHFSHEGCTTILSYLNKITVIAVWKWLPTKAILRKEEEDITFMFLLTVFSLISTPGTYLISNL